MKKTFLEVGKIVATHGIKGEVRVQPWCSDSELLTEFDTLFLDEGKKTVEIEDARLHKNIVILKLAGVNDINAAQAMRNKILYLRRDDIELEDGSYFIADLIGMKVIDALNSDKVYGEIVEITQTGANDVYHIKMADGKLVLIPAIADVIVETDLDADVMRITPLAGLFDNEEEIR